MRVRARLGDSFWLFSRVFHIPVSLIEDSNPQIDPIHLKEGQDIEIPGFQEEEYELRPGDTFFLLAKERKVAAEALSLLNPDVDPAQLQSEEKIKLPIRITEPIIDGKKEYDFKQLQDDIEKLTTLYPFIQINVIGKSVLENPIYELEVGRGKRNIHLNGAFHANEWITTPVLMKIVNAFALSLINGNSVKGMYSLPLYHQNRISIVPMVNPDGVNLVLHGPPPEKEQELISINGGLSDFSGWKANIRGVDLNNQFPANWEIEKERKEPKSPAPRDYPGDTPLSEPEAIAMELLVKKKQFSRILAFHTQGREFYWGYEGLEPEESVRLAVDYEKISGYKSVRYIDSHAGFRDWFIHVFRKPGFTFELGLGVNPLPISQFPQIYDEMLGVFFITLNN
jgi:g-D-glutamyl-meso-diaminopimelate peptidase